MSGRQNANKPCRKPYCKVCHDAGKSETDYTSHYVRSKPGPDGVVICPTILANECRYCKKIGHFPSMCTKLSRDKKDRVLREKKNERIVVEKPTKKPATFFSIFEALDDSDSDADESPRHKNESWPTLTSAPASRSLVETKTGYAEALARAKAQHECVRNHLFDIGEFNEAKHMPAYLGVPVPVAHQPKIRKPFLQRSWADDSDWSDFSDNEHTEMVEYWDQAEDSW